MPVYHRPVLLDEVIRLLSPHPGGVYVDCTFGGGGHAEAILNGILPGGRLIGLDRDQDAIENARQHLAEHGENLILVRGAFSELESVLREQKVETVDGVLFDLGVSSHQLDVPDRGFSFASPAPLDMRMDVSQSVTAADLVNSLPERELADLIYTNSDERWSRRIASAIVRRRKEQPISTTTELAELVVSVVPRKSQPTRIHPATRTFQALRIAVNSEIDQLKGGLEAAGRMLAIHGRLVAISYHSLEDRVVKEFFAAGSGRCQCPPELPQCVCGARQYLEVLTRKPITPTEDEIGANPRARSAKLRAAKKVDVMGLEG